MSKIFTITQGLDNLGALKTGGQGSVYKGRRTSNVYSAVKLIPTPIHSETDEDRGYRNFKNEVAKLQKVNEIPNPNIVKILSWGITDTGSLPFIEMEYIDGPDLNDLLTPPQPKIFRIKELLKVADQLACALAHCHSVGIKHGDIKGNNVKFNVQTGNYILLDFGLSILTDEQRRSSMRNAGAVEFMAPEQQDGEMLPQTDIYSYGVVIYELLTGQVPFVSKGNSETARNFVLLGHREGEVPDILTIRRSNLPDDWDANTKSQEMQIPEWFIALIYQCLQKKPFNRYSDGGKLHTAIINGNISALSETRRALEIALGNIKLLKDKNDKVENQKNELNRQLLKLKQSEIKVTTVEDNKKTNSQHDFSNRSIISLISISAVIFTMLIYVIVGQEHLKKQSQINLMDANTYSREIGSAHDSLDSLQRVFNLLKRNRPKKASPIYNEEQADTTKKM